MTREEAIKRIKAWNLDSDDMEVLEAVIPELRESENERIRKDIVTYLTNELNNVEQLTPRTNEVERWLAWLEKQKEPKWSPSEGEMSVLYKLCYISHQITDKDDIELTCLYQDLKREYFNGHSFENMFSNEKQADASNVEKAMREIEEKAKAFTEAHKGESADEILAQMRGEGWSKDERTKKELIDTIKRLSYDRLHISEELRDKYIAWIEKQRINTEGDFARGYDCGYECCLNSHGAEWLEKRKEQPITANDLDEEIHRFFDDCIDVHEAKLYGSISERVIPVDCYELTARHFAKWGEKQKEQKPNIELIQRSWYMEGYHDREFNMEPKWKVKAEKGGPRYYENPNYGKPLEQKDQKPTPDWMPKFLDELRSKKHYFDWDEHREIEGEILAIINWIAPDYFDRKEKRQKPAEWSEDIIRKAVKEVGLTQHQIDWFKTNVFPPKQGWSEEDENMLNSCISSIEEAKENRYYYRETDGDTSYDHEISWLKSLRPQPYWKPSEEQMDALKNVAYGYYQEGDGFLLHELHEQLKKLM